MKNQTIKWTKTEDGTYRSMNTNMIIFQILSRQEYGISVWHVAVDDESEYFFSGSLSQCKTLVLEKIKSMEWSFEITYRFNGEMQCYWMTCDDFKYGYRLFWKMVKELQLHKKSKSPVQIIDIYKNENNVRVAHPLSQYNDQQLGIMNSETPVATYHRVKSGKPGFETFECLVDGNPVDFNVWWHDVRSALKSGIATLIQDTDQFLTYRINGK